MKYERQQANELRERLNETPQRMTVIAGPRQVGKTTMVRQVIKAWKAPLIAVDDPSYAGIDAHAISQPIAGTPPTAEWLVKQWENARKAARQRKDENYVLALDEIQKIPRWSEVIKGLWDADRIEGLNLHVVLLGSSPWLMEQGLTESLAGRFELIEMRHWSFQEMQEAFDWTLDQYVFFGGYPGSAELIKNFARWKEFIRASIIEPNVQVDILQLTRIDKPALLRMLFYLGCQYSGQIVSYTKLRGELEDAGNTTTLAHYLDLLAQARMLTGLQKYAVQQTRQRKSPPKLNALNNALVSAINTYSFEEALSDRSYWGRLVESCVGAHLCNSAGRDYEIFYWREGALEVDFVISRGQSILAVEVKSAQGYRATKGLDEFCSKYQNCQRIIIGEKDIPLAEFLSSPIEQWIK